MNEDNATMEATPVESDTVVFLSPSAKLLVNLHLKPQRKYSSGGVTIIEEEVARIQFMDGRYETSDQREIEMLREAPNNVTVLQDEIAKEYRGRGIDLVPDSKALSSHKDRFFELTERRVV